MNPAAVPQTKPRLAVVGGGVAGIVAAHLLQDHHDITIFDRNDYLGGHTHTIPVPAGPDSGTPVDTGFIVFNDQTYPLFKRFLVDLGVRWRDTTMSFSFHDETTGFQYAGTGLNGLFTRRGNLINPFFWRMLLEIRRFSRLAMLGLDSGNLAGLSLQQFLTLNRFSRYLTDRYVVPMGAAIWSTSPAKMLEFPVESLMYFWRNHGLLSLRNRPQWHTVEGGSQAYVKAFLKRFNGAVRLESQICEVRKTAAGIQLTRNDGKTEVFDRVVIAAHADQALSMLAEPTPDQSRLLGPWRYQANRTVLHTDTRVLPPKPRAWAAWNYCRETATDDSHPVSVTYDMNLLQGLKTNHTYCVSLNGNRQIAPDAMIAQIHYDHPTFTAESMQTQPELSQLNQASAILFCGSYFGYGFHEDAVRSAVQVAEILGGTPLS